MKLHAYLSAVFDAQRFRGFAALERLGDRAVQDRDVTDYELVTMQRKLRGPSARDEMCRGQLGWIEGVLSRRELVG